MGSKQRLIEFIEHKNLSQRQFASKTGLSHGILTAGENIGSEKLSIIMDKYPEINLHWLVTGEGEMLANKIKINLDDFHPDEIIGYVYKNLKKFEDRMTYKMFLDNRVAPMVREEMEKRRDQEEKKLQEYQESEEYIKLQEVKQSLEYKDLLRKHGFDV